MTVERGIGSIARLVYLYRLRRRSSTRPGLVAPSLLGIDRLKQGSADLRVPQRAGRKTFAGIPKWEVQKMVIAGHGSLLEDRVARFQGVCVSETA